MLKGSMRSPDPIRMTKTKLKEMILAGDCFFRNFMIIICFAFQSF